MRQLVCSVMVMLAGTAGATEAGHPGAACPSLFLGINDPLRDPTYAAAFVRALDVHRREFAEAGHRTLNRHRADDAIDRPVIDDVLSEFVRLVADDGGVATPPASVDPKPGRTELHPNPTVAMAFLETLTGRARKYRVQLSRATDQGGVDAVLVHFINYIAVRFGVDYTLYPMYLADDPDFL